MPSNPIFVTGGTGYIGRPLIGTLLLRGHSVHALVRAGSEAKLPAGALPTLGNALDASTFAGAIPRGATFVHLIGTPHPNPTKAAEFQRVDLASVRATVAAAQQAGVRHLVYVSVAHPAPVMHAYIAVREQAETLVQGTGIPATIVRPWYVLGPGHRWPCLLLPFYAVLGWFSKTRESAQRLGLVSLGNMVATLQRAIEGSPPSGVRIVEVAEIRRARL